MSDDHTVSDEDRARLARRRLARLAGMMRALDAVRRDGLVDDGGRELVVTVINWRDICLSVGVDVSDLAEASGARLVPIRALRTRSPRRAVTTAIPLFSTVIPLFSTVIGHDVECVVCRRMRSVRSFPTVSGGRREQRCRECRDGHPAVTS